MFFEHPSCHFLVRTHSEEEKASPLAIAILKAMAAGEKHITGWKKCVRRRTSRGRKYDVVELRIPLSAQMRQPLGKKCRASRAEVVAIYNCEPTSSCNYTCSEKPSRRKQTTSHYDATFKYVVGKTVKPRGGSFDRSNVTCATGVHFFLTKQEAANYLL